MSFLTDFADQAVILPVAAVILASLLCLRQWRLALAWTLSVVVGLGIVAFVKMLAFACSSHSVVLDVRSPSGHVVGAEAVYGGLALLCAGAGAVGWMVALLVGLAVAATRVGLGVHTPAEVVAGGVAGVVALCVLAWLARGRVRQPRWVVAAVVIVAVVLHGAHLEAEPVLHRMVPHVWPFTLCD